MDSSRVSFCRKYIWLFLICIFLPAVCANADNTAYDVNAPTVSAKDPNDLIVDINVAIIAAADYLPSYYPGDWQYFDHFVCYDINGVPAAYTIIFRDPNALLADMNELNTSMENLRQRHRDTENRISERLAALPPQDANSDETLKSIRKEKSKLIRSQYFTGAFATVMTAAVETEPVLLRCYRGLPDFLVKQAEMQEQVEANFPDQKFKLQHLIYFNPVDIRYEVSETEAAVKATQLEEKRQRPVRQHISCDDYVLAYKGEEKGLKKLSVQREQMKQRNMQKAMEKQKLNEEQQQKMDEGIRAAKQHNASNWAEYKVKYEGQKSQQKAEEGGREK
jgi:hypothetical protein